MTKIWLWNLLAIYVDDHVWISRKLVHRCFMLSLSFQGSLFNLLGFVLEQNSAANSLRGTMRKKEARWCRQVILACVSTNLCVNKHVCVYTCVQLKKNHYCKSMCLSFKEWSQQKLHTPWVLADPTEIQANPSPLKSWSFLYSRDKDTVGTIHILHLNFLI